jgi:hypothetical protein
MENIDKDIKHRFTAYCKECDFNCNRASDWIKHTNSQKHLRNGEKMTTLCDKCGYIGKTHWMLTRHHLSQHATIEEKLKQKLYCNVCDIVFFSNVTYNNHMLGIQHKNIYTAKNLVNNN